MARRKSYSRNRKSSNGRIIALLVLFFLVILVIWQFRNTPGSVEGISQENIDAAILAQSNDNQPQPTDNTQVTNNAPPPAAAQKSIENPIERTVIPPATTPPPETVGQLNPNNQKQ